MREDEFDVVYRLLDDDLVDSEGRRCGRVDDIELEGGVGQDTHLSAILSGPGAWRQRFPRRMRRLAARVFSEEMVRVPWGEVKEIDVAVHLKRRASDLGLGHGDDVAGAFIAKIPGAW
ncbi:MAG: hypothetical protein QOG09_1615 [Solirubrobacterales bacterium]|jgi:sporulation protein YlmC with PRC-barrel domain|nr:hypothetical protein [Solirubrobacterales bacterium]MDX6663513.1 hypothetical protein [Solirubrobacterales bacterium]